MTPSEEHALIQALLREHPEVRTAAAAAGTWINHVHTWAASDGQVWWVDTTGARDARPGFKIWATQPTDAHTPPIAWISWQRIAEVARGATAGQLAWF